MSFLCFLLDKTARLNIDWNEIYGSEHLKLTIQPH